MAAATNDADDTISAINVTPFVDIVLVLLIILMVTSTQLVKAAVEVELPKAASGGDAVEPTINVVLTRDGQLHLDGHAVSGALLSAKVRRAAKSNPKTQAVIAADQGVPYGKVVKVIDLVKQGGVRRLALDVDREAGAE